MPNFKYDSVEIVGIEVAVPKQKVNVTEFNSKFGEEAVDKFSKATGIKTFYKSLEKQTASDLGYAAAQNLFNEKNIDPLSIEALVFVTQSPDYRRPATACVLQKRLGIPINSAVFDVNLGCSGFVYGLQVISSMIQCSDIQRALLILGETATKLTNPNDHSISMMFGDAGAAILLDKKRTSEINISLKSDGSRYRSIILPAGGFRDINPPRTSFICSDGNERTLYDIFMDGTAVFSFSISDVPDTIFEFLNSNHMTVGEFDCVVFHQANQFIIKQLIRKLKIDPLKVPISLDRFGNSGGVSIPLTICDTYGGCESGIKKLLVSGFGIGLSWGAASFSIDMSNILPIIETDNCYEEGRILPGQI